MRTQDVVTQAEAPSRAVGVVSLLPRFAPDNVTRARPEAGPLAAARAERAGAS